MGNAPACAWNRLNWKPTILWSATEVREPVSTRARRKGFWQRKGRVCGIGTRCGLRVAGAAVSVLLMEALTLVL